MAKSLEYAKKGAIIFAVGNALINAIKQIQKINNDPDLKFDWRDMLKASGRGALIGGAGGALVGGLMDISNAREEPLNTSSILNTVVTNMRLNKNEPTYKKLSLKAKYLEKIIKAEFKEKIAGNIVRIGSTETNTALKDCFDIDIAIPFGSNSFSSIQVMFDRLFDFIEENYYDQELIKIRKQRKSIGLIYDFDGEDYKIDIVPYKISKGKKKNSGMGYLQINSDSLFGNDSYTKTDIKSLTEQNLSNAQKKILLAFKIWKQNYSVPLSSHLTQLLILDAYNLNKGKIPRDFTGKILMVIRHIRDNIMFRRIVSIENTNNVLTDMKESKKKQIKNACQKVLNAYNYQPNTILDYFD